MLLIFVFEKKELVESLFEQQAQSVKPTEKNVSRQEAAAGKQSAPPFTLSPC